MPRKHTLGFISQDEYRLIAIVTNLKDYRFTFYLNQALRMDMVHYDDIAYARTGSVMCTYPWFYYHDHQIHTSYYLIGNKHIGGPMLATIKEADYVLLVKSPIHDDQVKQLVAGIRSIENVVTAFEVQIQTIKDINSVLDTNELHELEQLTDA